MPGSDSRHLLLLKQTTSARGSRVRPEGADGVHEEASPRLVAETRDACQRVQEACRRLVMDERYPVGRRPADLACDLLEIDRGAESRAMLEHLHAVEPRQGRGDALAVQAVVHDEDASPHQGCERRVDGERARSVHEADLVGRVR